MTAQTVADYFLTLGDPEVGDGISNMKIQKLLYYAQGIYLAIANEPLFDDPIEAWRFGPVVPDVYHRFKTHGFESVPVPQDFDATVFSADQRSILDEVNEAYGQFSAWKLRDMTHDEAPWRDADARGPNTVITHEALRAFFLTRLV